MGAIIGDPSGPDLFDRAAHRLVVLVVHPGCKPRRRDRAKAILEQRCGNARKALGVGAEGGELEGGDAGLDHFEDAGRPLLRVDRAVEGEVDARLRARMGDLAPNEPRPSRRDCLRHRACRRSWSHRRPRPSASTRRNPPGSSATANAPARRWRRAGSLRVAEIVALTRSRCQPPARHARPCHRARPHVRLRRSGAGRTTVPFRTRSKSDMRALSIGSALLDSLDHLLEREEVVELRHRRHERRRCAAGRGR